MELGFILPRFSGGWDTKTWTPFCRWCALWQRRRPRSTSSGADPRSTCMQDTGGTPQVVYNLSLFTHVNREAMEILESTEHKGETEHALGLSSIWVDSGPYWTLSSLRAGLRKIWYIMILSWQNKQRKFEHRSSLITLHLHLRNLSQCSPYSSPIICNGRPLQEQIQEPNLVTKSFPKIFTLEDAANARGDRLCPEPLIREVWPRLTVVSPSESKLWPEFCFGLVLS